MEKRFKKILRSIGIGVPAVLFLGACFDFYPFVGDDLVVREIQFCTFVTCMVMGICTVLILSEKK